MASGNATLRHPTFTVARRAQTRPTPCRRLARVRPRSASDSANLDRVAELLVRTGFDPQESLMLLVPEAYRCARARDMRLAFALAFVFAWARPRRARRCRVLCIGQPRGLLLLQLTRLFQSLL